MTVEKEKELKRLIKEQTGIPMKDITIQSYGCDYSNGEYGGYVVTYSYYKTNYDRVTNRPTYDTFRIY